MVDLSVKIGDITLQNPVTPASGAFSWEYNDVIDLNRLGGLVAKTICREPRLGNPTPRMAETEAGITASTTDDGKLVLTSNDGRAIQVSGALGTAGGSTAAELSTFGHLHLVQNGVSNFEISGIGVLRNRVVAGP